MADIKEMNSAALTQKFGNGELSGRWNLVPARSSVTLATKSLFNLVSVKGSFTSFDAYGEVGPTGEVQGRLTIAAASIATKNTKRDTHLRSADFFTVDRFPSIVFELNRLALTSAGASVEGTLTVLETTKAVSAPATVELSNTGEAVIELTLEIDRSEFGLTWAKMGASVKNTVTLHLSFAHA